MSRIARGKETYSSFVVVVRMDEDVGGDDEKNSAMM